MTLDECLFKHLMESKGTTYQDVKEGDDLYNCILCDGDDPLCNHYRSYQEIMLRQRKRKSARTDIYWADIEVHNSDQPNPADTRGMFEILETIPVSIRASIRKIDKHNHTISFYAGLCNISPAAMTNGFDYCDKNGVSKYCVLLAFSCDNMAETLVHEVLHARHPNMPEEIIHEMTNVYWNKYPTIRKTAQDRIIKELDYCGI